MEFTLPDRQDESVPLSGHQADYDLLFQEYWSSICHVVYQIVGDMDEAQDLALEAFIKLYRRPPAKNQNLGGWLYRVATNLGLNALRARKRRQHYEAQAGKSALETPTAPDPEKEIERRQDQMRVRAVLGELKTRSAQVLILRYSGLSYAEIATALGIAPGSVGVLLARAEREFEKQYNLK